MPALRERKESNVLSVLNGKEIFVTAGSTRAYLDAVRYISNSSSGRLGALIASECLKRGAYVSYFHGEGALSPVALNHHGEVKLTSEDLSRLDMIRIETVPELAGAIERELKEGYYDAAIHAMAVLDYVPDMSSVFKGKTKSDKDEWTIKLVPTPKIIDMIKKVSPDTLLVGFKLEVGQVPENLLASARKLMERCGAEMVIANDLAQIKHGTYKATLIERDRTQLKMTQVEGKPETAVLLCDHLEEFLKMRSTGSE